MAKRRPARKTRPVGRPSSLTPAIIKKICGAIRGGNYRGVAAQWAGVPERTFWRWCQEGKEATEGPQHEFWQAILEAEKAAEIGAVELVMRAAAEDPKHAEWWLERKFPKRWGRKDSHKVKIENEDISKALEQEFALREKAITLAGKNGQSNGHP